MHAYQLPQEEPCPVSDRLLGDLYRASPQGLTTLVETVPRSARAMLAVYCYRRSHLNSIALAIASTCDKNDLINFGGDFGAALYEQARRPRSSEAEPHSRKTVTLSQGTLMKVVIDQDLI